MNRRYCYECGSELLIRKITPTKTFRITARGGGIVREDNNKAFHPNNDDPYFVAICSEDAEHMDGDKFGVNAEWIETFEEEIKRQGEL